MLYTLKLYFLYISSFRASNTIHFFDDVWNWFTQKKPLVKSGSRQEWMVMVAVAFLLTVCITLVATMVSVTAEYQVKLKGLSHGMDLPCAWF